MDPAIIGGITSLLGGLFGRNKQKTISAGDNAYSHVEGIMRAAKTFGWNPLTLMGSVSPMAGTPGFTDNTALGQGIAQAGQLFAESLAGREPVAAKLNAYQAENKRLQERLNAITLRPRVPGVYGSGRGGAPRPVSSTQGGSSDDRLNDPVALADGADGGIAVPEPRLDRGSGSYLGGIRWESAPGWSPASVIEEDYGDVASWGYGIAKVAADTGHNLRRASDYLGLTDRLDWIGMSDPSDRPQTVAKAKRKYNGESGDTSVSGDWWKHQYPQ